MKPKYRNIFLIIGIISIAIMLWTFDVSYQDLMTDLKRAGQWLPAVFGVWIVIYFFNAASWFYIIRGGERPSPVNFWRVFKLSITGFALNYATPCGLMGGEPYRIMELSPYVGTARATSSVILFVMMHIFSHVCFWLMSLALFIVFYEYGVAEIILMSITGAILLLIVYFFMKGYRNGMVMKSLLLLTHIPFIKNWARRFIERQKETLEKIDSQIAELHGQKKSTFYMSLILEFTARVLTSAEIFFILKIMMPEVSILDSIMIMAFTSLFANIFFFSPMQLGAREGGFALAVGGLAISPGIGVYTGLITRVREIFWIAIGLTLMKIGNKKNIQEK